MARFDVYPNPGQHAKTAPYLLDVNSNSLDGLDGRMGIPHLLGTGRLLDVDHFPDYSYNRGQHEWDLLPCTLFKPRILRPAVWL